MLLESVASLVRLLADAAEFGFNFEITPAEIVGGGGEGGFVIYENTSSIRV